MLRTRATYYVTWTLRWRHGRRGRRKVSANRGRRRGQPIYKKYWHLRISSRNLPACGEVRENPDRTPEQAFHSYSGFIGRFGYLEAMKMSDSSQDSARL